jgi:hypothetical protein
MDRNPTATLLPFRPDQKVLVAGISGFLLRQLLGAIDASRTMNASTWGEVDSTSPGLTP